MWSCEYCAIVNAKMWRTRLLKSCVAMTNADAETKFAFITITLASEYHATDEATVNRASQFIAQNWDALIKRLKRWLGKFQYVRVLESHADGTLHVHLLITAHLPDVYYFYTGRGDRRKRVGNSDTLKNHLIAIGFGFIHDVKNLEDVSENATQNALAIIGYVTKYISKSLSVHDLSQRSTRLRKILTSRQFILAKNDQFEDDLFDWQFRYGRLKLSEFEAYLSLTDTRSGKIDKSEFDEFGRWIEGE